MDAATPGITANNYDCYVNDRVFQGHFRSIIRSLHIVVNISEVQAQNGVDIGQLNPTTYRTQNIEHRTLNIEQ